MSSIPASAIVSVTPSVLSTGGTGLTLSGLQLSNGARIPIGSILSFGSASAVGAYCGLSSVEYNNALVYFAGFTNSNIKPSTMWLTQYNQNNVPAYVRGASTASLSLDELKALVGTLVVSVDGVTRTSSSIDLSTATSPSSAASIMQAAFTGANLYDGITTSASTIAAGTATNSTSASISGYTLTVSSGITGSFVVGGKLSGTGVTSGTTILEQLTGSAGGAGTYRLDVAQTVTTTTITQTYGVLTVAAMTSGTLYLGSTISGGTIVAGTKIASQIGGTTGGAGTYVTTGGAQTVSATIVNSGPLSVSYDSISGGYVITGGASGAQGTIGYVSGSISTALFLTQATGSVLSQGADAAEPAAFMDSVINQNTNWATFWMSFDPDNGVGNATKLLFSDWNGLQNNQYEYNQEDTDVTPTLSSSATTSFGYLLKQSNISGTVAIYDPDGQHLAAFKCGLTASINYNETNGRVTSAFRSQSGVTPSVTTLTAYQNLVANGYNCYGAFATRAQGFNFYGPGTVSGEFEWDDSYVNQIWLNSSLQLDLMNLLVQSFSVPYNSQGYAMCRAAMLSTIQLGLTNGVIRAGVPLSSLQISLVNTAAGAVIDTILSTTGWYLQILPATAQSRGNRTSPPMTLWYCDGGSIQQINLASIEVQ